MKKILIILLLSAFGFGTANAQQTDSFNEKDKKVKKWTFGVKGGFQHNEFRGSGVDVGAEGVGSFFFGGLAERTLNDKFSLQFEALYTRQSYRFSNSRPDATIPYNTKGTLDVDYVNIPILAKYYIKKGWSLEAGTQFGFKTREMESTTTAFEDGSITEFSGNRKRNRDINFSLSLGTTYEFQNGIFVSGRYNRTIPNGVKASAFKINNDNFQLSVGYKF